MTTRAEMRAIARETLADTVIWPDKSINAWIADGIRDYSNYFKRQTTSTIVCTANVREYSLASLPITDLLRVEFPKYLEPPRYLMFKPETSNIIDLPVYDVRGDPPITLVIGELPVTGDEIEITYSADHLIPENDDATLTVPDIHLEIIRLFVIWQAIKRVEIAETADPDRLSMILGQLGINAVRAERVYRYKLEEYRKKMAASGRAGPWVMDSHDRIY
ncbi:MAG: hypothetical protein IBX69_13155 [Anaerolineales bacterium]|nr:hypothetical protein [Anaerolineales bacterium]